MYITLLHVCACVCVYVCVYMGVYVYRFFLELEPNVAASVEDMKNPMYDPTITTIDESKHVYPNDSRLTTLYNCMA